MSHVQFDQRTPNNNLPDKFVVGITGGIGSGKSTVARLFSERGVGVIDTDQLAHQLTQPGGLAIPAIRSVFGDEMITPDGALNRAAMRTQIFQAPVQRQKLEAILHPLIRISAEEELEKIDACYAMLVVPLLFETFAYRNHLERTLLVDCHEKIQIERVKIRSGLAEQDIRHIMNAQIARPLRLQLADDVISNQGILSALEAQVQAIHNLYISLQETSRKNITKFVN